MSRVFKCRRTAIAFIAIGCLFVLGMKGQDVASAIAAVAIGLAGANAGESAYTKRYAIGPSVALTKGSEDATP